MAQAWSEQTGIGLVWLRPFIVYGPGQRGDMVIPYAVDRARNRQPAEFSDCKQVRDFIYIDDVVRAIQLGVEKRPAGVHEVNLGNGEPVAVRAVLEAIAAYFDAEDLFQLGVRQRRAGEPDTQVADFSRATELFGWKPKVRWDEGIRRMLSEGKDEG